MQKMTNTIQNYAWGSPDALTQLYGIANPTGKPMAELWMGAHTKSSSQVEDDPGVLRSLRDLIQADQIRQLGDSVTKKFAELPFLFKVLCAEQPLSIQVHPSKAAAERGYAKENAAGIPLNAPERNYKDANHKPELVFALTPFLAMNGFRELHEIASLLAPVSHAHPDIALFLQQPSTSRLTTLFASLLSMDGAVKTQALEQLKKVQCSRQGEPWETIRFITQTYPDDSGLFSPLLLNVVQLQPGDAMFLHAETPHAYLSGVALEVMANSDNVLRAGLTPKFIDIAELLANVQFCPQSASDLLTTAEKRSDGLFFLVPVEDFAFSLHDLSASSQLLTQKSAAIIFCVTGEALLEKPGQSLVLKAGESCFIAAFEPEIMLSGHGRVARVYNAVS